MEQPGVLLMFLPATLLSLVWTSRGTYGFDCVGSQRVFSMRCLSNVPKSVPLAPKSSFSQRTWGLALQDVDAHHGHHMDVYYAPNVTVNDKNGLEILEEHDLFHGVAGTSFSSVMAADVPMPTEKGGYSHTVASKAKISAANKGKTPWNKGKQRSEEEKAKIAAGVRAKNRERFLQKLQDLGLTEQEYQEQKKAERRKRDAERRARKTANGGYTPTMETRQKISKILKEKHARGEIRRKKVDPDKVRRGFVHSEETRRKISESLKKRWANDAEYRSNMQNKTSVLNSREEIRQKISETLKKKWQDPEFRQSMMAKITKRSHSKQQLDPAHREKISEAMKLRWQDSEYRKKITDSLARRTEADMVRPKPRKRRPPSTKSPSTRKKPSSKTVSVSAEQGSGSTLSASSDDDLESTIRVIQPLSGPRKQKQAKPTTKRKTSTSGTQVTEKSKAVEVVPLQPKQRSVPSVSATTRNSQETVQSEKEPIAATTTTAPPTQEEEEESNPKRKKGDENGSVSRLREERRDLYELLYGEENVQVNSKLAAVFELEDDNLDTFDPYGLEDF